MSKEQPYRYAKALDSFNGQRGRDPAGMANALFRAVYKIAQSEGVTPTEFCEDVARRLENEDDFETEDELKSARELIRNRVLDCIGPLLDRSAKSTAIH